MLYTDGQHLVADSEKELHQFAQNVLGFKKEWYHDKYLKGQGQPNNHPHYDVLVQSKKRLMLKHPEVKRVPDEQIPELAKKMIKENL